MIFILTYLYKSRLKIQLLYHHYKILKWTAIMTISRKKKKHEIVFKLISNCTSLHNHIKKKKFGNIGARLVGPLSHSLNLDSIHFTWQQSPFSRHQAVRKIFMQTKIVWGILLSLSKSEISLFTGTTKIKLNGEKIS